MIINAKGIRPKPACDGFLGNGWFPPQSRRAQACCEEGDKIDEGALQPNEIIDGTRQGRACKALLNTWRIQGKFARRLNINIQLGRSFHRGFEVVFSRIWIDERVSFTGGVLGDIYAWVSFL